MTFSGRKCIICEKLFIIRAPLGRVCLYALVLCKYLSDKCQIELNSQLLFDPKPNQLFRIFTYSFKRNIYNKWRWGTVCQCENVADCSAIASSGLDSWLFLKSYIWPLCLTKYWKNTTACLHHKPQTVCLLMPTFENGKNDLIQHFE